MNNVKESAIKAGQTIKDYSGELNEVLIVSNVFDEVREYDNQGECEYELGETDCLPNDCLFIAARNISTNATYVFPTSRNSEILGE